MRSSCKMLATDRPSESATTLERNPLQVALRPKIATENVPNSSFARQCHPKIPRPPFLWYNTYRYSPLKGACHFRFLEILHGNYDNSLDCRLSDRDLDSNDVVYEALSYAWGDSRAPCRRCTDKQSCFITENLSNALRSLRYIDRHRLVWADAIWS